MAKRFSTLVAATALIAMSIGVAEAQTSKKIHMPRAKAPAGDIYTIAEIKAPALTVRKRSFLDPGNVVAAGSETPEYIAAATTGVRPITSSYAPAFFGESTLPGRFDLSPSERFYPKQDLDFSPF